MLRAHPELATQLGMHDRDSELVPVSQALLDAERAWIADLDDRLSACGGRDGAGLSLAGRLERGALAARIRRQRLDLESLRPLQNDPGACLPQVEGAIRPLLERRGGSPCLRFGSVARRLEQVPEVMRAAKVNLASASRLATEEAIVRWGDMLDVLRVDLPAAARPCRDPATQARLSEADSAAVHAMVDYVDFLREDVASRARDSFALGGVACARLLLGDGVGAELASVGETQSSRPPLGADAVQARLDSLLDRGREELARTRARMESLAVLIAPSGRIRAALDSLAADRPPDTAVVQHVEAELAAIRAFLGERRIVTLPARARVSVREVPLRAGELSPARLDAQGVWERGGGEAWLSLMDLASDGEATPPHPGRALSAREALTLAAFREALPGRYLAFLARQGAPSRFRQAFPSADFVEGWASYCETLMPEQGYGGGARLELAERAEIAREVGRLLAAISLHARGMSLAEAAALFREQCFLDSAAAEREARLAALDPERSAGTLGRWRILDLREEARSRLGERFDLRAFHDALLRQSAVPLPLARSAVLRELGIPEKP